MIKIKCNYLNGAVAVPTEIIDKHLKLASAASFKVLLFILRNPQGTADAKQISMCTGLSEDDVKSCLEFWESNSVIEITDEKVAEEDYAISVGNAKAVSVPEEKKTERIVTVKKLPVKKPTQREIAERLVAEPELEIIYKEAQNILGTFGYDTQGLLLMIYDFYGFPPEVIITLLQHQKNEGKIASSAIKNRAEDWAKRGIDTLELVEEELLALDKIKATFLAVKETAEFSGDVPTTRIAKFLRTWAVDWECSDELIKYALENNNKSLNDTNKMLKKFVQSGISSPEQVIVREKKSLPKSVKKTYETEEIGKNSVLDWIKKYANGEENE